MDLAEPLRGNRSLSKHKGSICGRDATTFQQAMLAWYEKNRRDYLWRLQDDPYRILAAEIMLQQTNADKVEPVYTEFIARYPSVSMLVQSGLQDLKALLSPLGLDYRAARLKNVQRN